MEAGIAAMLRRLLGGRVILDVEDDVTEPTDESKAPGDEPWTRIPIDTSVIDTHPIREELALRTGTYNGKLTNAFECLKLRQQRPFINPIHISQRYLPTWLRNVNAHDAKTLPGELSTKKPRTGGQEQRVFCGQFSRDGSVFMSACQDQHVRLYRQKNDDWVQFKEIQARDVGWSIVDTHYSPNNKFIIYSTWSNYVQLCNIYGDELHEALDMEPESTRFCLFSIKFSPDNREILGGSSDASLYLYDIERQKRILCVLGHDDDINTVAFADASSQLFITGSDDTMVKVWDRRLLHDKKQQRPVGTFNGHYEGVTWIDAKGDGRYFVSNGKDQCAKLWDIRKMAPEGKFECPLSKIRTRRHRPWDYRWERYPFWDQSSKKKDADTSLMTYRGHSVLETLIRCYFSPAATTGQKYIVTGSHCGNVHIYDILTGKIVKKLAGHHATVRDVSWHPYQPLLISSSWDCTLGRWEFKEIDELPDTSPSTTPSNSEEKSPMSSSLESNSPPSSSSPMDLSSDGSSSPSSSPVNSPLSAPSSLSSSSNSSSSNSLSFTSLPSSSTSTTTSSSSVYRTTVQERKEQGHKNGSGRNESRGGLGRREDDDDDDDVEEMSEEEGQQFLLAVLRSLYTSPSSASASSGSRTSSTSTGSTSTSTTTSSSPRSRSTSSRTSMTTSSSGAMDVSDDSRRGRRRRREGDDSEEDDSES